MIERAMANGETLFVIAADLSNAFPSTERSTLWLKMHNYGFHGKIFDWIRMIYTHMSYFVRHANIQSAEFKSFIGILIGDTASPGLWNIYASDFRPNLTHGNIILNGICMPSLEQADDTLLCAITPQRLLSLF
jgi:hypothetical protein